MPNALIDTGLLLDYLAGDAAARAAIDGCGHCSISVITWLDVMALCPPALLDETRAWLRTLERLSVSEAIADEAHRLMLRKPGLGRARALVWASAVANQLVWLTGDASCVEAGDRNVWVVGGPG